VGSESLLVEGYIPNNGTRWSQQSVASPVVCDNAALGHDNVAHIHNCSIYIYIYNVSAMMKAYLNSSFACVKMLFVVWKRKYEGMNDKDCFQNFHSHQWWLSVSWKGLLEVYYCIYIYIYIYIYICVCHTNRGGFQFHVKDYRDVYLCMKVYFVQFQHRAYMAARHWILGVLFLCTTPPLTLPTSVPVLLGSCRRM
jgi:hypothetical protein